MKSLRRSSDGPKGMSKILAILLLIPCVIAELIVGWYMFKYGFRSVGLMLFIAFLWNAAVCIGLTVYILTHRKLSVQDGSYMEVSNYLNLNKIGRDKL
jgi:hypothetical protein